MQLVRRHSPFSLSSLTLVALLTLACRSGVRAADTDTGAAGNGTEARDVRAATGVTAGLAVHLGTTDGKLEAALARDGRVLVHGIALDDASLAAARRSIRGEGLYGPASVERGVPDPLPYADNLVNLVVADEDQLAARGLAKGFSMGQVMRVLAPGGQAYVKQSGHWTRTIKPRPAGMDDWSHFDHDAQGNGVSHDKFVKPPNFIQWVDDIQAITLGGNPAAYRPFTSFRCQGGRAFFEWSTGIEKGSREKQKQQFYSGRDAFNGLPLWDVTNTTIGDRKEMQFVAAGDQLFAFLQKAGPLVALDGATGKVLRNYEAGGKLTDDPRRTCVRYAGETLVESSGDTLYALDTRGGALKWKYVAKDADVLFPVVAPAEAPAEALGAAPGAAVAEAPGQVPGEGKVFATLADPPTRGSSRWPVAKTLALVCLDLKTGKELWRNDELKGAYVGQIVYHDGNLALFASAAIGGGEDGQSFIGDLDPADGKLRWRTTFKKSWNTAGYNMIVRDRSVYYADAWRVHGLGLEAGEEKMAFDGGGYNQRCNRFSATDDYFMFGLVTYVDKNATGDVSSITRSGCAQGAVPANGLIYFTPNACQCIAQVRGYLALSPEPLGEPVPDEGRLDTSPPPGPGPDVVSAPAPPAPPAGPIADDWAHEQKFDGPETAPLEADGRTFVAVIHEHRLECRDRAGKVLWSYTAGGRVSSPPVVSEGRCYFGSHDGYVYCLNAADGKPLWRFLAAPRERKMMAWGQLASSWPVFGVVLHDGALCASAGLHPEVGGGIWVWGLEPATGRVVWKKILRRSPVEVESKATRQIHPNRVLNDVLKSEGEKLALPGISFDPAQPDEQLAQDLAGRDEPKVKGGSKK